MLVAIITALALVAFNPFRPVFHLFCTIVMSLVDCLRICSADQQTGFLMKGGYTGSVELRIVRKDCFEYVLVHNFLFIVRFFLALVFYLLYQPYL